MENVDKLNCLKDYYKGNLEFLTFIMGLTYDNLEKDENILDKKMNNAARVGCLISMFLAVKEDLVEKKENLTYDPKIFIEKLEEAANIIATKTEDGYVINGYTFKDAPTLVAEIRNKLAHGDFKLDLQHSRIILNKDGRDIIINIKYLCAFVLCAVEKYSKRIDKNEYNRNFILTKKMQRNRKKPITNKEELKRFIKTYYQIKFKIEKKDGKTIEPYITNMFENFIDLYKINLDNKYLWDLKKMIGNDYNFTWETVKINNENLDDFATTLLTIIPDNLPYDSQVAAISHELVSYIDPSFEGYNPILAGAHNLMLLDVLYENQSSSKSYVVNEVVKKYGEVYFNYNEIAMAIISVFNALFLYSMDDLFKNSNEYTDLENNGFEYDKIDLSFIVTDKYTINNPKKEEFNLRSKANKEKLQKIDDDISKLNQNLRNVKDKNNFKAENAIKNAIDRNIKLKNLLSSETEIIEKEILKIENFEQKNEIYLKNKAIIEGIRNSIAHGNYIVKRGKAIEETRITFVDLYNDEIYFACDMPLRALLALELASLPVVEDFINKKNNTKKVIVKN